MKKDSTTALLVRDIVLRNPYYVNFLRRDLINTAALARELLPVIKRQNEKATIESISVAIKRLELPPSTLDADFHKILGKVQLKMRDGLCLLSIKNQKDIPQYTEFQSDDMYYLNQGADEVSVIIDQINKDKISKKLIISSHNNLAAISLKGPYRECVGFVYTFTNAISGAGINIMDMISTQSQFTFIIEEKYALDVYKLCKEVLESSEALKENQRS